MAKITSRIEEWIQAGVITQKTGQNILEYEAGREKKPWVLYGFIMLGIFVLSLGVVSIVAANWKHIPGFVKIAMDFIILLLIVYAIYRIHTKNNPLVFDGLVALFFFLYLASIGLISQVYHSGGEIFQALFLLSFTMLPVTLLTYKKFMPGIWTFFFLLSISLFLYITYAELNYQNKQMKMVILAMMTAFPFICGILGNLFFVSSYTRQLSSHFFFWAAILYFIEIAYYDFIHSINGAHFIRFSDDHAIYFYIVLLSMIITALATTGFNKSISLKYKIVLALTTLVYFFSISIFVDGNKYPEINKALGFICSIPTLLLLSWFFSSLNMKRMFNIMLRLTALRALIIYFQVVGSLAYTGLGLIISGMIIISGIFLWMKFGKNLENKIGEFFNASR
ncbi:MAG: DUF2157 domain-containing protein [Spirochaetia bacterium]|nr:DUF2157 domain-containing protein [Spirochaetia bacterium]